ncbi:MAG: DUF2752 domain-containing protein [Cryomorphaceae bacterium]|nr:DUF2752 domain-containing protein [Cryomorphaceae bacterium]
MTTLVNQKRNINRFYILLTALLIAGGLYLFIPFSSSQPDVGFCPLHSTTGVACPGCGTGKGVRAIFQLDLYKAWMANPFSFPLAMLVTIAPFWITFDLWRNNYSFFRFSHWVNVTLSKSYFFAPIIALLITNWIWNIFKYTL